jgi:hypothetical protein
MATTVIKQLLTNHILEFLPEELVREVKDFAFIDMQSHTNKCNKDIVNHQINNAEVSSLTLMVEQEQEEQPYFGDIWDDPENDPWADDDIDYHEVGDYYTHERVWAFCENNDCAKQYQCVFCTKCGNYIDGFMHNNDLLIDKGLTNIPYPELILCNC